MTAILLRTVALALLLAGAGGTFAEPVSFPEPADPLPGRANVTYLDLVRLLAPGIVVNGRNYSAGRPIPVRHIGGPDEGNAGPASSGRLNIAALPVRSGGMDRAALLLDFTAEPDSATGFTILALFDVTARPRLLDAADVAFDRSTSFADPARLPAGAGDDLVVTRSTHFNSNQGYADAALILVRDGRLELVDTIFAFDENSCAFERTQRLDIELGAGEPFSDIVASVTERIVASGAKCGETAVPEPGTRTITATYHWKAAGQRYIADSDALVRLARESEARF